MEAGIIHEVFLRCGLRESLVVNHDWCCYLVFTNEFAVGSDVKHVAREAFGTHGLHGLQVKRKKDRDIPLAFALVFLEKSEREFTFDSFDFSVCVKSSEKDKMVSEFPYLGRP